jgi:fido (protein-threonine AMPylation protein)
MATPGEKLATSLEVLQRVQKGNVLRSSSLGRVHRERLLQNNFLLEVVKGWYVVTRPALNDGSSTPWFASYWTFVAAYLNERYGDDYCLSSESSLHLHTGATVVPRQLVVIARAKGTQKLNLPFDTSLLIYQDDKNFPAGRARLNDLWVMDLPTALCKAASSFFRQNPADAELALRMVRDSSDLLRVLLEGGSVSAAGRLAGAYEFLGEVQMASRIARDMASGGYPVKPTNPFENRTPFLLAGARVASPYVARIESLWRSMRDEVSDAFPAPPGIPADHLGYLHRMDEIYVNDAYNSLSIEGYQVTPRLIEQIRDGKWNPDASESDRQQRNALAAKGYNLAFRAVKESIGRILEGARPAQVVAVDHREWYSQMFAPSVQAGMLKPADLAGYRNHPVYIKGSQHVPLPQASIVDCMEALFRLLDEEPHAGVRAVLGHFVFVFIHPYMDGNGRVGRFLMNAMLASGGYPWTVVRLARRDQYLSALELASTTGRISGLAGFLLEEMTSTA